MGTITSFNTNTLKNIRKAITVALSRIGLFENVDYRLSSVLDDRARFTIEFIKEEAASKTNKIKGTIRNKFKCTPEFEIEGSFIKMDFQKEYAYREELNNQ